MANDELKKNLTLFFRGASFRSRAKSEGRWLWNTNGSSNFARR